MITPDQDTTHPSHLTCGLRVALRDLLSQLRQLRARCRSGNSRLSTTYIVRTDAQQGDEFRTSPPHRSTPEAADTPVRTQK